MWVVAGLKAAHRHALCAEDRNSIAVGDEKSQIAVATRMRKNLSFYISYRIPSVMLMNCLEEGNETA